VTRPGAAKVVLALLLRGVVAHAAGEPTAVSAPSRPRRRPRRRPRPGVAPVDEPAAGPGTGRSRTSAPAGSRRPARSSRGLRRRPESYEVAVRLAWLNLQQRRLAEAIRRYRAAARWRGGPEAAQGLAAALTAQGYQLIAQGHRREARAAFAEAERLDPKGADARVGLKLAAPPPCWRRRGGWAASPLRWGRCGRSA